MAQLICDAGYKEIAYQGGNHSHYTESAKIAVLDINRLSSDRRTNISRLSSIFALFDKNMKLLTAHVLLAMLAVCEMP